MGFTGSTIQSPFDHGSGKGAYSSGTVPPRYDRHALSEEEDERVSAPHRINAFFKLASPLLSRYRLLL
jgi:hypothetical protein